ncbi:DUF3800 domain-containing protein [Kitasatospora sp. NPDC058115]|uniref:DUF3800 domain-containing protein n=1 Tax=Kitasatospora sp. NPDC058115 TaxID=3346347 RepID=UPI0036DABA47
MDDSGDGRSLVVFAALGVPDTQFDAATAAWTRFRQGLPVDVGLRIPDDAPLHSEELIGARGRAAFVSRTSDRETHRDRCRQVVRHGLLALGSLPLVSVHVAYRRTDDYRSDRPALFTEFLAQLNADLADAGEYGRVIVDGNGTDGASRNALRRLPSEDLRIRDLSFAPARHHHLLQAADMVAYAAFQDIAKAEAKRFMWGWSAPVFRSGPGPRAL